MLAHDLPLVSRDRGRRTGGRWGSCCLTVGTEPRVRSDVGGHVERRDGGGEAPRGSAAAESLR